jgi:hypothetical protein
MKTSFGLSLVASALLIFGLSQAAAQAPHVTPPPLVPCEDAAEGMPCVEIVTDVSEIVGVWRRFYQGATDMAYQEFRPDGTFSIVQSLPSDERVSGTVTFDGAVAAFAANPDGPAPPACIEPGLYELRLIRIGDQSVALSYSLLNEDGCALRVADFSMPMIAYTGSGDELVMDPDVPALAQPLVPCPEETAGAYPCDVVATGADEIAGIWRQYITRPDLQAPDGMGYQRIRADGSVTLADTPEHTAAPHGNYPYSTLTFDGREALMAVDAPGVPPMCQIATYRFHAYRYGTQDVALLSVPIEDDCLPRLQDLSLPLIWVAGTD